MCPSRGDTGSLGQTTALGQQSALQTERGQGCPARRAGGSRDRSTLGERVRSHTDGSPAFTVRCVQQLAVRGPVLIKSHRCLFSRRWKCLEGASISVCTKVGDDRPRPLRPADLRSLRVGPGPSIPQHALPTPSGLPGRLRWRRQPLWPRQGSHSARQHGRGSGRPH